MPPAKRIHKMKIPVQSSLGELGPKGRKGIARGERNKTHPNVSPKGAKGKTKDTHIYKIIHGEWTCSI